MKILMVCLGNICRSPMAQGVMERTIAEHALDWTVDSAGTNGYHDGEGPDPRAVREARRHGIDISRQRSRKIRQSDLEAFDLILAMDRQNLLNLHAMCHHPSLKSRIHLLMDYAYPDQQVQVPDPYYDDRFAEALQLIQEGCQGVIRAHHRT